MFRKYHYLDTNLNPSAKCYCMTVNNKIAGFMAIGMLPHPIKPYRKVHRLVILPDYQGIGLGKIFLEEMGKKITDHPFSITTSQPALINCLKKSPNWRCIGCERGKKHTGTYSTKNSLKRIITTFVYKGDKK